MFLGNPDVHNCIHRSSSLVPVLNQLSPFPNTTYFARTHFSIILQFIPRSLKIIPLSKMLYESLIYLPHIACSVRYILFHLIIHQGRLVHVLTGECKGGPHAFLSHILPYAIFLYYLYHFFNHFFHLLYWPPLHAEHVSSLPYSPYHSDTLVCHILYVNHNSSSGFIYLLDI